MTTIANPSAGSPIVRTAGGVPNTTMATLPHGGRRIVIIKIGCFADLYCVARGRVEAYRAGPRLTAWFDALGANDHFAEGLTFQIDRQTWQLGVDRTPESAVLRATSRMRREPSQLTIVVRLNGSVLEC